MPECRQGNFLSLRFKTKLIGIFLKINQNADGHSSKLDKRTSEPMNEIKTNAASVAPKKTTWASIASQPAKLTSKVCFKMFSIISIIIII